MSFFAVLFALIIEQFRPLPRDNRIRHGLVGWVDWAGRNFDAGRERHAWVVWCVTVLTPSLAVAALFLLLHHFSVLLALVCGLYFLDRRLGRLEYETFMLQ